VLNGDGSYKPLPIALESPEGSRYEMQAVLPGGRFLTTTDTDKWPSVLFIHDPAGQIVRDINNNPVRLEIPPVTEYQGGSCSPNGKVYIATNMRDGDHQLIFVVSLLNGFVFGTIRVAAFKDNILVEDELEGIRFFPGLTGNGTPAQLWAVMLENQKLPRDNIFFKAFACSDPAHA